MSRRPTTAPRRPAAPRRSGGAVPPGHPPSTREALAAHLRRHGLKHSRQRDAVVEVFLGTTGHVSVDELTARVRVRDPEIGATTVYRTMKLLAECGLASPRHFGDGQARYEPERPGGHHDHLVCDGCGRVVEFEDDDMEELQDSIARRHGFALEGHTFEIHGTCKRCAAATAPRRKSR